MSAERWLPEMTAREMAFYEKCPKNILFELFRKITKDPANKEKDGWVKAMHDKWRELHDTQVVPVAPPENLLKPFNW